VETIYWKCIDLIKKTKNKKQTRIPWPIKWVSRSSACGVIIAREMLPPAGQMWNCAIRRM